MTNRVIGPGVGLPAPQIPYPANLVPQGISYAPGGSNFVGLAPGQALTLPAGDYMIDLGKYSILQIQDPVNSAAAPTQQSGVWRPIRVQRGTFPIRSDGQNFRIANLLGCPVSAVVTNGGTGYVQASTTVTPSSGNSTWQAIVGGRLEKITLTALGAGYGIAPEVFVPAPPSPGVQATAVATIVAGALTAVTLTNVGAGYPTAPTITILPSPYDPNFASITAATGLATLTGSGAVSALICTNPGLPVTASLTLTIAGVGTSALATPSVLFTLAAISASAIGSGTITGAALTTYGGVPTAGAFTNPDFQNTNFLPRQAQVAFILTGTAIDSASIIDGGMFLNTFSPLVQTYGGVITVAPTFALVAGTANDVVMIQPL